MASCSMNCALQIGFKALHNLPDTKEEHFFQIWNVHSVLNVLYSLVEKSKINRQVCINESSYYFISNCMAIIVGDVVA